jgi:alkyl sulfatase BDS1-like metallo-beta-lactamase superfamily hydrolase
MYMKLVSVFSMSAAMTLAVATILVVITTGCTRPAPEPATSDASPAEAPTTAAPDQGQPKGASVATKTANKQMASKLNFDDRQSFEDATRNLIAPLPNKGVLKNAEGKTAWNLPQFDFLAGDKPAPDTVNPSLWRQAQIMQRNAGLFKVTDGIYQVRGIDISNATFIEGKTGIIVMDPILSKETAQAALALYYEHRPKKPVVAVIISHSHVDHYGGVLGVTTTEDVKSGKVKVYVPEGFTEAALDEGVIGGNRQMRLSGYQYSMLLEKGPKGNMTGGLGLDTSKGQTTFVLPTDLIEKDKTLKIDGLDFEFMLAPDTEAPAEMYFYIPKYKALTTAEDAVFTLHNVYTLRGAKIRSAYNWSKYLQKARMKWGDKAEVLFAPHHWPIWDKARISEHLKRQSTAYKFIDNQAVRLANSGYDMYEAAEMLGELPGELGTDWGLRGYYGTMSHNVKAAYVKHFGYYSGNPSTLHPLPRVESGKRYVEYMGGAKAIMDKARKDYAKGEYRWTAQVLNHLVYAEPDNMDARNLLADTLEQLAYQSEAGTWRGWYLSGAKDLREGVKPLPVVDFASPSTVESEPIELFLDYLAIRLDAQKAAGKTIRLNLDLTDTKEKYLLEVQYGVLMYYEGKQASDADATVALTRTALNGIIEGQAKLADQISAGKIKVTGQKPKALDEFVALLVTFDGWYNVVTPIGAK